MNEPSNAPMFDAAPSTPEPFYQIWIKAVTRPNEQNFAEIANSPDANPNKAYLWMFLVGLVTSFLSVTVNLIFNSSQYSFDGSVGVVSVICAVPVGAGLSVLFFAIGVAIVQWVASLFGGTGKYNQLVYIVAAYSAPIALVGGLVNAVASLVPSLNLCVLLLISVVSLYFETVAVKAVNNFDWGKAIASVLIPFFVILFVCGCLVIGLLTLLAPAIGDVFSTINQSLGY